MNAYMVESDKRIEPFGDHPRDCLIGNQKLGNIQEDALQSLGIVLKAIPAGQEIDDPQEHLSFQDSLFFTKELLQEFVVKSRKLNKSTVCAVKPPDPTLLFHVVATQDVRIYADRVEYGLRYTPALGSRNESLPLVIDVEEHFGSTPAPDHMVVFRKFSLSISEKVISQIDHWTNLHDANIAVALRGPARLLNHKAAMMGSVLRSRSFNQWKIGRRANKIGKNCNIHPTAWIEYSDIGDNVTIGAGAVVSLSVVGDNCCIGSNVILEYSVLGDFCWLGSGAVVRCALLYPGVFSMARLINEAVCGRDAFLGDGVTLTDYRLDGRNVTVIKNGHSVDTGSPFVGACMGHEVYLGAGCIVAPGRAVPNGMRLSQDRSRYISAFDADGSLPGYRVINVASGSRFKIEAVQKKRSSVPLLRRLVRMKSVE